MKHGKQPGYVVRAAAGAADTAEILIYEDIGANWFGDGVSAKQVVQDLAGLKASTLNVRINSAGGDVFEGLTIFNALQRYNGRVVTHVDGLAASIASIIALAGAEVRIAENAFFMIHDPWSLAIGNAAEFRKMADTLDTIGGSLVGTYAKKTGATEDQVKAWMTAETWFTAEQAKEAGFADEITAKSDAKAKLDMVTRFANAPEALKARLAEPEPEEQGGPDAAVLRIAAQSLRTLERTRL